MKQLAVLCVYVPNQNLYRWALEGCYAEKMKEKRENKERERRKPEKTHRKMN